MNPLTNNPKNTLDSTLCLKQSTLRIRPPKLKRGIYYSDYDQAAKPHRVKRSLRTSNKAEAERLNRVAYHRANGFLTVFPPVDGVDCPLPLGDAILMYEATDYRVMPRLKDFESFIGAGVFLHKIKPRDIRRWAKSVKQKRGMKYSSLSTWKGTISTFFQEQMAEDRCLSNPTREKHGWPTCSKEERDAELRRIHDIKPTTTEERDALFALVDSENTGLGMVMRLAYFAGAERCAMVLMKHGDVDFEKKIIRVRGQKRVHRDRDMPLDDHLAEYLRSQGVGQGDPNQYLVHDYASSLIPITRAALSLRMWRFNQRHNVNIRMHAGRHDVGTRVHQAGGDAYTVGLLLGHADHGRTAAKYYIRSTPSDYAGLLEKALV